MLSVVLGPREYGNRRVRGRKDGSERKQRVERGRREGGKEGRRERERRRNAERKEILAS